MESEEMEIVIVGGGICGLATALALHRKGIKSVVLERSDSLRATGAAIGILNNGWIALDQLGVASTLRPTASPLQRARDIWLHDDPSLLKDMPRPFSIGEARCLKRSHLITALANELPLDTLRFGCQVLSINLDARTSLPILHLHDGTSIHAEVVIGCDGANSVVASYLNLKPVKLFSIASVRGFTYYPNGHGFSYEFLRMGSANRRSLLGRIPVDDKLVYWFAPLPSSVSDSKICDEPEAIILSTIESLNKFPSEITEMIKNSDRESISFTKLRYRAPWELLLGSFRKGRVTVAGDAMHVMGPFLGQGGAAGIEDAVVLGRCLGRGKGKEEALEEYLKERKMRVVKLSTQSYLTGTMLDTKTTMIMRYVALVLLLVLFRDRTAHTKFDCGKL